MRFGHGIEPQYVAVTPKFEPTLGELVDRLSTDRTLNDWQNFVPEKTVKMDGGAVLSVDPNTGAAKGEVRVTDPNTGGQKGAKLAELGALDPNALMRVAEVAGFGSLKYERFNFLKGYRWSLSYDAMQRHLHAYWGGQYLDAESGLPHLAHAAWHCLALMAFMERERGTDDRPT
jgi:hypothetical protein